MLVGLALGSSTRRGPGGSSTVKDAVTVIGIDVAAVRPSTAVALRVGRTAQVVEWMEADHRQPDQVAAMMAWIERHAPEVVAIDAPQGFKRSPGKSGLALPMTPSSRACDRELLARHISLYQVPSKAAVAAGEARLPDWMAAGFDYFRRLRRAGFEIPDGAVMPGMLGGAPAVIEVYPYGAFAALLGALPPNKSTRAGLRLRVVTLRRAGLVWDEYFDHDSLDALAAALTAWRFQQGRATPLGDSREGLIWLPVPPAELRDTYLSL